MQFFTVWTALCIGGPLASPAPAPNARAPLINERCNIFKHAGSISTRLGASSGSPGSETLGTLCWVCRDPGGPEPCTSIGLASGSMMGKSWAQTGGNAQSVSWHLRTESVSSVPAFKGAPDPLPGHSGHRAAPHSGSHHLRSKDSRHHSKGTGRVSGVQAALLRSRAGLCLGEGGASTSQGGCVHEVL